ncbi:MAG: hypothetical protein RLZZ505_1437 [Verrucomicrobiota bacterium]
MKNKYHRTLFRSPLLAFALASGVAHAGTTDVAPAPVAPASPEWLSVSGYAGIAYTYLDNTRNETFADGGSPLDAVKVGFTGDFGSVGAYTSLFWTPGFNYPGNLPNGDEVGILDAYLTYKTGDFTFTAGKYLSWLGYEAFDLVNMTQLSYANNQLAAIPAYHTGVKFDYATDVWGGGISVSDSVFGDPTAFFKGDDSVSNGLGYEAYVTYKGIDKLTLWAGLGIDDIEGAPNQATYDFWVSYALTEQLTLAYEFAYHDSDIREGVQGLVYAKYAFTDKFSTVLRASFDEGKGFEDERRYTVSPTYVINDNLLVRSELTYIEGSVGGDGLFSGVQAVLTF